MGRRPDGIKRAKMDVVETSSERNFGDGISVGISVTSYSIHLIGAVTASALVGPPPTHRGVDLIEIKSSEAEKLLRGEAHLCRRAEGTPSTASWHRKNAPMRSTTLSAHARRRHRATRRKTIVTQAIEHKPSRPKTARRSAAAIRGDAPVRASLARPRALDCCAPLARETDAVVSATPLPPHLPPRFRGDLLHKLGCAGRQPAGAASAEAAERRGGRGRGARKSPARQPSP